MTTTKEYPDFVTNTGYGTGGGLCGWNCRHNFMAFDPKYMENNLDKYGLKENEKVYKINTGKRVLERRIRKTKQTINAINAYLSSHQNDDDINKMLISKKILLNKQKTIYKQFCISNNTKPDNDRLFVI